MLEKIKKEFYKLLKELGYYVTDNGEYREEFPWLMIRTNGYLALDSFDLRVSTITLTLDIFSTYQGEKEIIDIVENIGSNLNVLKENSEVLFCYQKSLKILDDKSTGPIRKHGVVSYVFLTGKSLLEEEDNV